MASVDALRARSIRVEGGCLRWLGAHTPKGYGQIWLDGRARSVHRVAYEAWVGPIPEGHEIDHVKAKGCSYRDCFEPSHLEAVTHTENLARSRLTHCPEGHELAGENLKWRRTSKGYAARRCRLCFNADRRVRRQAARKKGNVDA